ncbi:MAG TPA: GNAT family N-acetyltransferase [Rhizomicrobium sp.]|jgi:GNAT superfamily N-acetyltransferase|nr:GNAT family N-acetyltransferase [Rhizomicrobium sp.]
MTIAIRLARAEEAVLLPAVEQSAGGLFRTLPDLAWIADDQNQPAEAYLPLIANGSVWVAADAAAGLVGLIMCEAFEDGLHVWELAVADGFQGRGIGRALLDAAVAFARDAGLRSVTLTTFRHVVWNGPFYARYGFVELACETMGARLAEDVRLEEERGLPNRCAMVLSLAPDRGRGI